MNVYLDESGFTGPDYINKQQPLFVLAFNWLPDDECKKIEGKIWETFKGEEIKFGKLVKTQNGYRILIEIFRIIGLNRNCYSVYLVDKKSALVRKFVDDCIDPILARDNKRAFPTDARAGYSNLLTNTLPVFLGEAWFEIFLGLYNEFIRSQNQDSLQALWAHCRLSARSKEAFTMLSPFISFPQLALQEILHEGYKTDVYEQAVLGLIVHLRNFFAIKDFNVVFDNTKATGDEYLLDFLKRLEGLERAYKFSKACTFHPDIKIRSTKMVDSKAYLGIQVSDIIAGSIFWAFKDLKNLETPLGEAVTAAMDARNLIYLKNSSAVTPEDLGMAGGESPWEQ